MAEYCLDCLNKLNGTNDPPKKYVISEDLDFCEGCGEMKHVVVIEKRYYHYSKNLPFYLLRVLCFPVELVIRLICGLYILIKRKRR